MKNRTNADWQAKPPLQLVHAREALPHQGEAVQGSPSQKRKCGTVPEPTPGTITRSKLK